MRKLLIIVFAVLLLAPAAALAAGGQFTDDDTSVFEADIEWLAQAGVTGGCNPPDNDNYCPGRAVTRGQMAAFMHRFAGYLGAEDGIVSEADHAATADNSTTADSATVAGDAATLSGLTAEDLIDSSPVIIPAAEFTPDGFAPFGDFTFGWFSTAWVYQVNGAACLQAPVSLPHGATLASAEVIVLDANGNSTSQYFQAELGDSSTFTSASGTPVASATSQTVTIDLSGKSASDSTQNWIGACFFDIGDSLYGARVHYSITDAATAAIPTELRPASPAAGSGTNLP